jgi:hypothetical protein
MGADEDALILVGFGDDAVDLELAEDAEQAVEVAGLAAGVAEVEVELGEQVVAVGVGAGRADAVLLLVGDVGLAEDGDEEGLLGGETLATDERVLPRLLGGFGGEGGDDEEGEAAHVVHGEREVERFEDAGDGARGGLGGEGAVEVGFGFALHESAAEQFLDGGL